jgi:hypothetical protein
LLTISSAMRGGDFLVLAEMHGETAAALRPRAQFGGVAEHLRQRHHRLDDLRGPAQLRAFDAAAARIQVADHVAHVLFRNHHFHRHDRLQQHRLGRLAASLIAIEPAILKAISEESTSW